MPEPNVPNQPTGEGAMPADLQVASATPEDRNMAMIAHLLGIVGFLGPLILFLIKKEGASRFLLFHMKQSLWFQVFAVIIIVAWAIISFILTFVFIGACTMMLCPLLGLGALVYAVIGGIQVNGSKDFEYYWVGPWVRKSL